MSSVFGWFIFAMFVWGCCIVMQAFQRRVAPEMDSSGDWDWSGDGEQANPRTTRRMQREIDAREGDIADLKQRIEVLEAIVTDRRYQWDREFGRNN